LDFVKMCSIADIALEKNWKMCGFLTKKCKQSQLFVSYMCQNFYVYIEVHIDCLKALFEKAYQASVWSPIWLVQYFRLY
jgi:hypothetical protein